MTFAKFIWAGAGEFSLALFMVKNPSTWLASHAKGTNKQFIYMKILSDT